MKLLNNRWEDKSSYKDRWVLRNKEMAIILNNYLPKNKKYCSNGLEVQSSILNRK